MSKLIILSNRVSLPNSHRPAAGGLAIALQDTLKDIGGIWLGWNGNNIPDGFVPEFSHKQYNNVDYITCPLQNSQYNKYYCGFANNTLWPAMHDRADLIQFNQDEYNVYQQVNLFFSEKLAKISEPQDIIWVHDYHFLSVAKYCRKLGMKNRIGFFLHIPFAQLNMWQSIPTAHSIIKDLSQFDIIGLQTESDQRLCTQVFNHFLDRKSVDPYIANYQEHSTLIKSYPIGVNPEQIQNVAQKNDPKIQSFFDFKGSSSKHKTIIGVDRIDYSKGLLERFNAFESFLHKHPEYYKQVTDLQIACPCRMDIPVYEDLYRQLKNKVNHINKVFSQDDWLPVNCIHETLTHELIMKIYRLADVCWVTSLRDGMNLVAKEYVASQDPDNPGVLILSKYTGAAEKMSESILIDPQDQNSMIHALETALKMSRNERLERYQQLIKSIKNYDVNDWRDAFLKDLKLHCAPPNC